MNDGDLAWVAGYLEGEGWFSLFNCNNPRFGLYQYPRVACTSTDLDVLQRLQRLSGVGRIVGRKPREPHHAPPWQWTVSKSREAVELMEAIYPHLGQRRRAKIDELLDIAGRPRTLRISGRSLDRRAWVAGFLEGEGAFYWVIFQKGKYGPYYYPRVGASSTDQDVIERLPEYSGAGQITGPYPRKPPQKTVWYWTVTNRDDAIALMQEMYPYMGERRRARIDEVLDFVGRQPRKPLARLRTLMEGEDGRLPLSLGRAS
jgi:hypothetical protein